MNRTEGTDTIEKHPMPVPDLGESFLEFLDGATYPCVGAKSALARGSIETHEFSKLGDRGNDRPMVDGLCQFQV